MSDPIEDYAVLSDCRSAALVSREGSIDWLCLPRYDAASVFGALLGTDEHGSWRLRPEDPDARPTRRYDGDTFVLTTRWESAAGTVDVVEFMPLRAGRHGVVRRVVGVSGAVPMLSELRLRFDYARAMPWVRQSGTADAPELRAIAGPEEILVRGPRMHAEDSVHRARWVSAPGETVDSVLAWGPAFDDKPEAYDVDVEEAHAREWWTDWAGRVSYDGRHRDLVVRSMLVLRALTHADTGGIVAAATTSLPEDFGGVRNWDYRYVWLRDAALTLEAYIDHGYLGAAHRWRRWLLRAVAGDPADVQVLYGIGGERDLFERELTQFPGYGGAAPVRVGNGAVTQFQADVLGEVLVALEDARLAGLDETRFSWALQRALVERVAATVDRPDNGIWEIRGEPQKFTHSRVMVWAALDRGVRAVEESGLEGPAERWRMLRDRVRADIEQHAIDPATGAFRQHEDTDEVDASLLLIPTVGFCAPDDPRMQATVSRIERDLMPEGFVLRYRTQSGVDGLAGAEHPFLACSFWLVRQYAAMGRRDDAEALMDRLARVPNDVGLMSEEFEPSSGRHVGNTPQALSHLALVAAADALSGHAGRAASRR
ncbi:glycoside hydrolase family 15 protein [Microbacterium sp. NPDC091313]